MLEKSKARRQDLKGKWQRTKSLGAKTSVLTRRLLIFVIIIIVNKIFLFSSFINIIIFIKI